VRLLVLLALALVPVLPHPARQVARLEGSGAVRWAAQVPPLRVRPAPAWSSFFVTGYDLTGTTASGAPAGPGVVATDPGIVPMYAWVQVQGYPGLWRALDTGGLIHGARLDLWFPTLAQCYQATGWRMARWSMRQSDFW
jgi:3D (Asp-Asp-Asp) domain-containing protein